MLFSGLDITEMLYRIPGILIGLSIHECAHAWVAYKAGDPTAKNLGRMTLDPLKHIDPIGFFMLILVGFGWARPVMVSKRNFRKPLRDDILVSLAGVVANFITAFLLTGLYAVLLVGFSVTNEIVMNLVLYAILINLGLCFFNLIPVPPLDGSHVFKDIFGRFFQRQVLDDV
ncbi:MAG: site-2 protease family protein [Eubacteriales bacterium]